MLTKPTLKLLDDKLPLFFLRAFVKNTQVIFSNSNRFDCADLGDLCRILQ